MSNENKAKVGDIVEILINGKKVRRGILKVHEVDGVFALGEVHTYTVESKDNKVLTSISTFEEFIIND